MPQIIATVGRPTLHEPPYEADDWHERDNFHDPQAARGYAEWKSRQYGITPYRIVRYEPEDRCPHQLFAVEYVPEWKLRPAP